MSSRDYASLPTAGECDVLVAGGGPAGLIAATAAARHGARTTLLERNPFLGGRATASYVLVLEDYTDGEQITVRGMADEVTARLKALGGAVHLPERIWHGGDKLPSNPEYDYWASWGFVYYMQSGPPPKPLNYAISFDPEAFKRVSEEMLADAGVSFVLYSDIIDVIKQDETLSEAVVRFRNGLARVRAKLVIDATGDGDVMAAANVPHQCGQYLVTLVHRIGGVDLDAWNAFSAADPAAAREMNREVRRVYGGSWDQWWMRTTLPGVVWVNAPHLNGYDGIDSKDLTRATLEARKRIWQALAYIKTNMPGWNDAYLIDTCPEMGMRQGRLLRGQYVVTKNDVMSGRTFEDSIGMGRNYHMPYRSIVPLETPNLLVSGRCFSCEPNAQRSAREIGPCMVLGQAAGTAAAIAVARGCRVQEMDVAELQARLKRDGAYIA